MDNIKTLHEVATHGTPAELENLLKEDYPIDTPDALGMTLLHVAAGYNSADMVRFILEKGANINAVDKNGWTPLHFAANNENALAVLLEKSSNVNAKTKMGETPLIIAVLFNNTASVKLLLDANVTLNEKDERGFTALHYAEKINRDDIAHLLKARGAE